MEGLLFSEQEHQLCPNGLELNPTITSTTFTMPEIAEVARTVHFIRKNLVGKTLAKVTAPDDNNIFGKAGTSGPEFQKHMTGKKVIDVGQQGKYFWIIMSSPPHPVMHFGMSGWIKYKHEHSYYYQPKKGEEKEEWPPKFWKFLIETKEEPKVEAAFVDMRRFGRIRLVDCKAEDIRNVSPLVENGPDPVIDKDLVTVDWLMEKCRSKKVPIKAMLLDQANISGIGNWVGDEIMYNAKMHPEQYANTLTDAQIKQLHKSIHHICQTAVDLLGDSEQFPEDWLFRHRWSKGKKDSVNTMPSGEKIAFLTVGGRTSAVVPSVQKKTGPVAKEMSEATIPGEDEEKPTKAKGQKRKSEKVEEDEPKSLEILKAGKKQRNSKAKVEVNGEHVDSTTTAATSQKKRKTTTNEEVTAKKGSTKKPANETPKQSTADGTKRRSGRLSRS